MTQEGDVLLYQTDDDGEITVESGLIEMSGGLETAAYLSLFGGNEDDDGQQDNPYNWWGNIAEIDPANQYRSETQNLLQALPSTVNNLRRIEESAKRDLAWMIAKGAASEVLVSARIPGINRVQITIGIEARGSESTFAFIQNWKASV